LGHAGSLVIGPCIEVKAGALWTMDFLSRKVKAGESMCLTVLSGSMQVGLRRCAEDTPSQSWDYESDKERLKNPRGCLFAPVAGAPGGPSLLLERCEEKRGQRWLLRSAKAASLSLYSPRPTMPAAVATSTTTVARMAPVVDVSAVEPSLFCFSVMLPTGYEPKLVEMQHTAKIGIFACEGWSVYTNANVDLAGFAPTKVRVDLHSRLGGVYHTFYNTGIFISIWRQVASESRFREFDFTVKADPDAVVLPWVLRRKLAIYLRSGRLAEAESDRGMFVNNCKFGLHGPVEILSKRALEVYASGWSGCKRPPQEDVFMQNCLTSLGVSMQDNFAVLVEAHCEPPLGWNNCRGDYAVFHPFKTVEGYKLCFDTAASFIG